MPQLDIFTFFGQVTWFRVVFVAYFATIGVSFLPFLNRSIKLREKKLSYQRSFVGESSGLLLSYDSSLVSPVKRLTGMIASSRKAVEKTSDVSSSLFPVKSVMMTLGDQPTGLLRLRTLLSSKGKGAAKRA